MLLVDGLFRLPTRKGFAGQEHTAVFGVSAMILTEGDQRMLANVQKQEKNPTFLPRLT